MKTLKLAFLATLSAMSLAASAAYDNTYYQTEYWSGEYPNGFSVVTPNVSLPARSAMDPALNITIQCAVPFKANFSPWNEARPAKYFSAAKIVPMTATEDLTLGDATMGPPVVKVKKGDLIEYLIYGAEGSFTVRYNGVEYDGEQDLLDKVTYDQALMDTPTDEWVNLTCSGGEVAWILLKDLTSLDADGNVTYLPGLDSWYKGFREYGKVTDLTDDDLKPQAP